MTKMNLSLKNLYIVMSVCVFSILFSKISYHTDMENLFLNLNPGLLFLAIISFILVTVMVDLVVIS